MIRKIDQIFKETFKADFRKENVEKAKIRELRSYSPSPININRNTSCETNQMYNPLYNQNTQSINYNDTINQNTAEIEATATATNSNDIFGSTPYLQNFNNHLS